MREVRCCCDARLLGYLPKMGLPGGVARFSVLSRVISAPSEAPPSSQIEVLSFEIETVFDSHEDGVMYLVVAYKSQDYPIEKLRRLPGWVDA